jgi:hypothetical protein
MRLTVQLTLRANRSEVWAAMSSVPVDRHRVEMVALPDGRGFRESSSRWWHSVWWHERTLLDGPSGCIVAGARNPWYPSGRCRPRTTSS